MTQQQLREQFSKEVRPEHYYIEYSKWLEKRIIEAEQRERKFAEWIGTKGYINRESNPNQWIQQMDTLAEEQFTTEQLYQKWEEQSK